MEIFSGKNRHKRRFYENQMEMKHGIQENKKQKIA
jgi:hypothetical protein